MIGKALDEAYESGFTFDVSDMQHDILCFALGSTHQSDYCVKRVNEMRFKSRDVEEAEKKVTLPDKDKRNSEAPIVFYDVEVFPNLFLVNWKFAGEDKPVNRMINPKPRDMEELFKYRLVGFNCRKYDNHMIYGRYLGLSNEQLYDLSQRIIVEGAMDAFYPEAYNISYTDIYDFCSKKQSLKKWEIELGIHHKELGLPWDQPVPEERWNEVAEYCDNDVLATEAVWNARQADFEVREVMAELSGLTVNATNRQHITKILVGDEKHPKHVYTNLATGEQE